MNRKTMTTDHSERIAARSLRGGLGASAFRLAGLAALCASVPGAAWAQSPSPMPTSPLTPWYYSAVNAHHGGSSSDTEAKQIAGGTADSVFPLPWEEGNGVATGIFPPYNGTPRTTEPSATATEIPSYVLGNYRGYNDFTDSFERGASATDPNGLLNYEGTTSGASTTQNPLTNYAPDDKGGALFNNFRDSGYVSWSAPLVWTVNNSQNFDSETLEDDVLYPGGRLPAPGSLSGTNPAPSGSWTSNPTWTGSSALTASTSVTESNGDNSWAYVSDSADGATNNNYDRAVVVSANNTSANVSKVVWNFQVANPGSYSLFVNIPNMPSGELRPSDAHYTVAVNGTEVLDTRVSQIEATNPVYIGGPYLLKANDTITLELWNDTKNTVSANEYVVADSATLSISSGYETRGGATAINYHEYPEVANASYYGIEPGTPNGNTTQTNVAYADPVPYGNYTTDVGSTTPPSGTGFTGFIVTPARHEIRQLVYFGDSELVTDSNGNQHRQGVFYCVDGFRGNVVWRYVCPETQAGFDNGVFTTPVVARINVIDPNPNDVDANGNRLILKNKLVVIFCDQSGKVYCLDAIGNGIATNGTVTPGVNSLPLDGVLNKWPLTAATMTAQPGITETQTVEDTTGAAHLPAPASTTPTAVTVNGQTVSLLGTTFAYWIYRPDPNLPIQPSWIIDDATDFHNGLTPANTNGISNGFATGPSSTSATGGTYSTASASTVATETWDFNFTSTNPNTVTPTPGYPDSYSIYVNIPAVPTGQTRGTNYTYNVTVNGTAVSPTTLNAIKQNTPGEQLLTTVPLTAASDVQVILKDDGTGNASDVIVADSVSMIEAAKQPSSSMPVPASFNRASPAIYVEPGTFQVDTVQTQYGPEQPNASTNTTQSPLPTTSGQVGKAWLYVTNSNGTLYSLDPTGTVASATDPTTGANLYGSIDIDPSQPNPTDWTPTVHVNWWFSARGANQAVPGVQTPSYATIESGPSILVPDPVNHADEHYIYFGTSHEATNSTDSAGRVYALASTGPVDNSGTLLLLSDPNYNANARPFWSFPDAYGPKVGGSSKLGTSTSTSNRAAGVSSPALGDITGTPVPFYNALAVKNGATTPDTRIYFAADTGSEFEPNDTVTSGMPLPRADAGTTGRVWSIEAVPTSMGPSGGDQNCWAFPSANDPNNSANDYKNEPQNPMGAFTNMTPAIGYVKFPDIINYFDSSGTLQRWSHLDTVNKTAGTGVRNNLVPMLYVGCSGDLDQGFYALDLLGGDTTTFTTEDNVDTGNQDDISRFIFRMESPNGFSWTSPPVLVTNADANPDHTPAGAINTADTATQWGNGGALFVNAGNTLYQIGATPVTNINQNSPGPFISIDKQFQGFGPLAPPCVAAANIATSPNSPNPYGTPFTSAAPDMWSMEAGDYAAQSINTGAVWPNNSANLPPDPNQVTDWVYSGDQSTGLFRGITPNTQGFGVGAEISAEAPTPIQDVQPRNARLPLHAYIFDGTTAHPSTLADMTPGNPGSIVMDGKSSSSFFDWGSSVYVRISNVVPPDPNHTNANLDMKDPTGQLDPNVYRLYNGSPVSYTITEVPADNVNSGSTFTDYQASGSTQILTSLPGDGFFTRSGTGGYAGADDGSSTAVQLSDRNGNEWIYASTYFIGNGTGHSDTPGAKRRIINATQTCQVWNILTDQPTNNTVTLTTEVSQGSQYQTVSGGVVTGLAQTVPSPDPTFGIANPLAVIGDASAKANLEFNGVGYVVGTPNLPNMYPTPPSSGNATDASSNTWNGFDMQAQGNFVFANADAVPKSGLTINYDPTQLNPTGTNNTTNNLTPAHYTAGVYTTTGYIHHGDSGTNALNSASFNNVGLGFGDRSEVGLRGMSIRVSMKDQPSQWFDSSSTHGPGARINPLPWEDVPTSYDYGTNNSQDYPDIKLGTLTADLQIASTLLGNGPQQGRGGDMVNSSATLDPRDVNKTTAAQETYNDPVLTTIKVPRFQPANLTVVNIGGTAFAGGYINRQRVFVDTNNNGQWDQGEAYRDFNILTGVPIDASTSMVGSQTVDVGSVPAGFGVQMDPYLTAIDPTLTTPGSNYPDNFSPYTPYFQRFFQPLSIENTGNVNLLNVHLDQKQLDKSVSWLYDPLNLYADGVDSGDVTQPYGFFNAGIPALDYMGLTLPNSGMLPGSTVSEQPFLVRSSLDSDLVTAYGLNPHLSVFTDPNGNPWSKTYVGATFHKARPNSTEPSQLTVPDVPAVNTPDNPWYTPTSDRPTLTVSNSTASAQTASVPYVSVAVPVGTPVGTYSQQIGIFDGTDNAYSATTAPTYGNGFTQNYELNNDQFFTGLLASNPQATLNVTVQEQRLTDAPSDYQSRALSAKVSGSLIPIQGTAYTAPTNLPDLFPSAVRDVYWNDSSTSSGTGDLSLLWSSARTPNSTGSNPALGLSSAVLGADQYGRFAANVPSGNAANSTWWSENDLFGLSNMPAGANYGGTIAMDQHVYDIGQDVFASDGSDYAFWINNNSGLTGSVAATANSGYSSIFCGNYDPATGQIGNITQITPTPTVGASTASAALVGISDVRGLKYSLSALYKMDPSGTSSAGLFDPNGGSPITDNLWAFWTVGGYGQSAIYYQSTQVAAGGAPVFSNAPLALPIPAGLSGVSSPSAVVLPAPDTTAAPSGSGTTGTNPPAQTDSSGNLIPPTVPLIEITYSGINQNGNSDIYVTRYRPYRAGTAGATYTALWPVPYPATVQKLSPDVNTVWWQAHDIGWARNSALSIAIANPNSSPTDLVAPNLGVKATYDKASGLLVYTNLPSGSGVNAVFVDLPHGRIRFSPALDANTIVMAKVNAMARRITSDDVPSMDPISFVDAAFAPNEAQLSGSAPAAPRVQVARSWFIFRKGAVDLGTKKVGPTLWFNTQRLGIPLYNASTTAIQGTNAQGKPSTTNGGGGLTIDPQSIGDGTTTGNLVVTDTSSNTQLYPSSSAANAVDVDWVHGYIYFPQLLALGSGQYVSPEGRSMTVTFTPRGASSTVTVTDAVRWVDEPRFNDGGNGSSVTVPIVTSNTLGYTSAVDANANNKTEIFMHDPGNDSMPWAFLDPVAYADHGGMPNSYSAYDPFGLFSHIGFASGALLPDQLHRVWLFWSSTRNANSSAGTASGATGTAKSSSDLYYEALAPAFGATP